MFRKLFATLLLTAVGAGLGFGAAKFSPTQWQASVQLEPPKIAELGNYFALSSTFHLISGDSIAADVNKMEEKIAEASYAEFKKNIQSEALRNQFLASLESVKAQAKFEGLSDEVVAQQLSKQFQFKTGNNQPDTLILTSLSAQEVDKLFGDYLRYINQQTKSVLNNELSAKWKSLFQQVKTAADAKLDQTWENKLKMMQSAQPLDDQLVAFHFVNRPSVTAVARPYVEWASYGAGAGLLLALLTVLIIGSPRKTEAQASSHS